MKTLTRSNCDAAENRASLELLRRWVPAIALPCLALALFPAALPRWEFMWALAFATYLGCKWITWAHTPIPEAPMWKQWGYWLAWPGLDPASFLDAGQNARRDRASPSEWLSAVSKLSLGLLMFSVGPGVVSPRFPYLIGWIGMIGIVMALHFGLFHVLSCAWRAIGVNAQTLMNRPLASVSISEFWGRRWNTAFRDLTHRYVFRPLVPRWGVRWSLAAVFLLSGLVHELVISIPARGGYGGPTLFFFIQFVAILASRAPLGRSIGLSGGLTGRMFAALVLLCPACLLFHRPFVLEIVLPFMHALGAIR